MKKATRALVPLSALFLLIASRVEATPSVNAGSPQTVTLPASAILNGTASDTLSFTTSWTKLSYTGTGTGTVTFYDATQLMTSAQFSDPGTYVLQLTATDIYSSVSSNVTITVNAPTPVSGLPSQVTISGTQLLVANHPYTIQGVTYSPSTQAPVTGPDPITGASVQYGFFFDDAAGNRWRSPGLEGHDLQNYWLKQDFRNYYAADIALMAQMHVNTVRLYADIGDIAETYQHVLDKFHQNGIMVIMSVASSQQDIVSGRYLQIVQMCKYHPAILMWSFGNEWNLNNFYGYPDMATAISAINQAAANVKAIDPSHPVTSSLGDKFALAATGPCGPDSPKSDIPSVVNGVPNVDIWGINVYRGVSFGTFFSQWKSVTSKPFYFSEFGTDSFATTAYTTPYYNPDACVFNTEAVVQAGAADQATQASFDVGLWQEIAANASAVSTSNNCAGGFVYTFNDPLWKVGNFNVGLGNLPSTNYTGDTDYNTQDMHGFALGGHPDGVANEEYFGIVDASRNPKQAFQSLKALFANQSPVVSAGPDQTITLPAQATLNGSITPGSLPIVSSTWSVVSGPGNVVFTSTYTAITNASFSAPGTYGLQLQAFDGQNTATSSMTATVQNPPAPTANSQTLSTAFNTALPITLTGSDPSSLPLTYSIVNSPTHGTLGTLNAATGAVTYMPNLNYTGSDSFSFNVNNGYVNSASPGTITINVGAPPTLVIGTLSATPNPVPGTQTQLSASVSGGVTPYSFAWTVPANTSFNQTLQNPTVTFSKAGLYSFPLTVTDALSQTANQTLANVLVQQTTSTINVMPSGGPYVVGQTYPFTAQAADQFGNSMTLSGGFTWSISPNTGATIDAAGNFNATLASTYQIIATDGGQSGLATITVGGNPPVINSLSANPNPINTNQTTLSATFTGGVGPYTYAWSKPANTSLNTSAASPVVTFSKAGTYTFSLILTDSLGSSDTKSLSNVVVNQTLTSMTLLPNPASVPVFGTQQFTATALDQFGQGMSPTLLWSVSSGGGSISASGLLTAGSTVGTNYSVTVSTSFTGSVKTTVPLTITNPTSPTNPAVTSFAANPLTITTGQTTVLSWTTTNATNVSINQGVGSVALNSQTSVSPSVTTTYTLTATGSAGTTPASQQLTVTVNPINPINLPAPDLSSLNGNTYTLQDTLSLNYAGNATGFNWEFNPINGSASAGMGIGSPSAVGTPVPTAAPRLSLASLSLLPGQYTMQVQAVNGPLTSVWASATITLISTDLSTARVHPNPFRAARGDTNITFDQMTANSTVKIFTVSGRWIKTLPAPGGSVSWDLTNDSGEKAASGLFLYVLTDNQGNKMRGKFTVIR